MRIADHNESPPECGIHCNFKVFSKLKYINLVDNYCKYILCIKIFSTSRLLIINNLQCDYYLINVPRG